MKSKNLKLNNPCTEKWENMKPNKGGGFCESCAKNVIDFTQLSHLEISEKLKKTNGNICARLTKTQLQTPLLDTHIPREFRIPYSNIAAGVLVATVLSYGPHMLATNSKTLTEIVQMPEGDLGPEYTTVASKASAVNPIEMITFTGNVSAENGVPVEHAKVAFITVKKIIEAYTAKDGSYTLKIPAELIDDDNVIRVFYDEIKNKAKEDEVFWGFENSDYILSNAEIKSLYKIKAEEQELYLGGIGYYSSEQSPIVIYNGKEIAYKEFIKAQKGSISSCSLENKDYYYFSSEFAIAIYGTKAKDGLYLLTDKQ